MDAVRVEHSGVFCVGDSREAFCLASDAYNAASPELAQFAGVLVGSTVSADAHEVAVVRLREVAHDLLVVHLHRVGADIHLYVGVRVPLSPAPVNEAEVAFVADCRVPAVSNRVVQFAGASSCKRVFGEGGNDDITQFRDCRPRHFPREGSGHTSAASLADEFDQFVRILRVVAKNRLAGVRDVLRVRVGDFRGVEQLRLVEVVEPLVKSVNLDFDCADDFLAVVGVIG